MIKYFVLVFGCLLVLLFCLLSICPSYEASGETGEAVIHYGKIYQNYTITFENTGNVPLTDIVFNVTRKSLGLYYPFLIEETKQVTFDLVPPHTTLSNTTTFTYPYLSIEIWSKYTHERVSP